MGDVPAVRPVSANPIEILDEMPPTSAEAGYVKAARATSTLRGYRSNWREFTTWCGQPDQSSPLPAALATVCSDRSARATPQRLARSTRTRSTPFPTSGCAPG